MEPNSTVYVMAPLYIRVLIWDVIWHMLHYTDFWKYYWAIGYSLASYIYTRFLDKFDKSVINENQRSIHFITWIVYTDWQLDTLSNLQATIKKFSHYGGDL